MGQRRPAPAGVYAVFGFEEETAQSDGQPGITLKLAGQAGSPGVEWISGLKSPGA